jgi:hypothetical protein
MNLRDVGMIERRQHLGLTFKTHQTLGVSGQSFGQHLDGYFPIQPGVTGFVYFTHSAGANGRKNLVGTEFVACRERHGRDSAKFSRSRIDQGNSSGPNVTSATGSD